MKLKLSLITLMLLAGVARSESPATAPSVDDLINHSIEASGGVEKLSAIKSTSIQSKINIVQQNLSGTMEMIQKGSNALITMNMPQIGSVKYGMTGEVAYEQTDLMGTRLLKEDEKEQAKQGMDIQAQLEHLKSLTQKSVTGPEQLGDAQAWKLTGKNASGDEETNWIDVKSHQVIKNQSIVNNPMGKLPASTEFSNFKTIDGITMPMMIMQSLGPVTIKIELTEVKINPEIADEKFALPDDVKQLVEQAKKEPATQPAEKTEAEK